MYSRAFLRCNTSSVSRFWCLREAEIFHPMSHAASPDVTVADSPNEHIHIQTFLCSYYLRKKIIPHHPQRRGPVGGFSHPLPREASSIVQLLMMIVMMACPSLIRNSTPLIKGPGAPVLMAAGPSPPESDSRRGEARRHPWHTPVDRATKQKRVTLAPPPPVPLSSPWVPQTRPILLPSYPPPQKPQHLLLDA